MLLISSSTLIGWRRSGEEDDSELDEAEKLSFGLPASEVLVFS